MNKRAWFEQALAAGVFVRLDPRCAGVVVPRWVKKVSPYNLVLQFGLGFPTPIRDLEVDDEGVSATLSFDGKPFHCVIPWTSVYIMDSDAGAAMWSESLPPEMLPLPQPPSRGEAAASVAMGSAPPELSQRSTAPTADVRPISRAPKRTEKQAKRPKLTLIRGGLS